MNSTSHGEHYDIRYDSEGYILAMYCNHISRRILRKTEYPQPMKWAKGGKQ